MRVVIAEDSVLLREGLVRLLEEQDCEVLAVVGDGDGLLKAVDEYRPEVCVVDVRMPPTFTDEGLRAALVIRQRSPEIGVLVLSQYVEERYARGGTRSRGDLATAGPVPQGRPAGGTEPT
jgi:DNA-binding NarL/FixJ family response regulator